MQKIEDFQKTIEKLNQEYRRLGAEYAKYRKEYGRVKSEIDLIYAANMQKINGIKKNAGYETGLLILIGMEGEYLEEMYKKMVQAMHNYKALDRLLDSLQSSTTSLQSLMRYYRENEFGDGSQ